MGQDLFKTGLAREITSGADHDAALEAPGEVIETGLAVDIGKTAKAKSSTPRKSPTTAQKRKVEQLEAERLRLDTGHAEEVEKLQAKVAKAQADLDHAEREYTQARKDLDAKLKAARKAI